MAIIATNVSRAIRNKSANGMQQSALAPYKEEPRTMNKHLSLATCIRLKTKGFSQNHTGMAWLKDPYQSWCRAYGTGREGRPFLVINFTNAPVPATQYFHGEWVAEPPIIDASGTGGVLFWLKSKLADGIINLNDGQWSIDWREVGLMSYDSPEALVNAALDAMASVGVKVEAKQ
mgnify:FL=1